MSSNTKIFLTFLASVLLPPTIFWAIVFTVGEKGDLILEQHREWVEASVVIFSLVVGMMPAIFLSLPLRKKIIWYLVYIPLASYIFLVSPFVAVGLVCMFGSAFGFNCDI